MDDADDDPGRRSEEVDVLHRAAALIRDDSRAGALDELESGPFIRLATSRLLDAIAESIERGEQLPVPVEQIALVMARHAVSRLRADKADEAHESTTA